MCVQHEDARVTQDSGRAVINSTEWLLKKKKMSHLELECLEKPAPVNLREDRGKIKGSMDSNVSFCTISLFLIRQNVKKKRKLKHSAGL